MKLPIKIKTFTRIQIIVNIVFTIVFILAAAIYYFEKKGRIKKSNQELVQRDLDELVQFVENHLKRDRDVLNLSVNIAEYKINSISDIEEIADSKTIFRAVDPYTNEPFDLQINSWKIDGVDLTNNYQLVDEIKKISGADVSIYLQCDKGYVNISTSIVNTAGDRMTGDIILYSSSIAKMVESGNQYSGRFHGKSAWYIISYKPIFVNGKMQGIYYISIRERMGAALKIVFEKRNYFRSGYPFMIADNGSLIIHPTRQGEDFSQTSIYKNIIKQGKENDYTEYRWPESGWGRQWSLHYKYHEPTRSYLCITHPKTELFRALNVSLLIALAAYLVFFVILQLVFVYALNSFKDNLKKIKLALNKLAKGEIASGIFYSDEKEFAEIAQRIDDLSVRYQDLAGFAKELANDNFSQTYPNSFINDDIGESLIKMNDKLNEAMYNEHIRRKEEKLRSWESDGLSKFVTILQRNRDKLDELCYELISNMVVYLNANLGAIFFLNKDNPEDIHFMQMATYAFDQKKIIMKKIYPEQGLLGRLYNEKQTIYLSEIPDDYISIATGMGDSSPRNLLIVPLLINKEVYGAVEIASLNVIKGYQIEFIEKIGENIASTINNVLVNNKTKELLEQSRAQSELLSAQEEKMRKNLLELRNIQIETESGLYEMKDSFKKLEDVLLMVELNKKGEIIALNQSVADFLGMQKSILIGKHFSDYSNFVPVDEYKGLIKNWENLMGGKKVQSEIKVKSGSGKLRNILLQMVPEIEIDNVIKVLFIGIERQEPGSVK